MSEIVIQIPEPVKSEVGEERACRCFCPLLFNEECVINARVNYGPGPHCPGANTYALVPVADLARMREALRRIGDAAAVYDEEAEFLVRTANHDNYTDRARSRDRQASALKHMVALALAGRAQKGE